MAGEWTREVDQLRDEHNRDIDRIDQAIQRCITEKFYIEAQKQTGERIEGLASRFTTFETERKAEATERQRDRSQMKAVVVGSAFTFIVSGGLELLRLVSK